MNGMCRPLFKVPLELQALVEKSCSETLTDQECARLNELLRGSAEARSFYLGYLSIHARLSWEFGPRPPVEATTAEGVPVEETYAAIATGEPVAAVVARPPSARRRRSWAVTGAAAAVATLLVCVFLVDWTPEVAQRPEPRAPTIARGPVAVAVVAEDAVTPAAVAERPAPLAVLSGYVHQPGTQPEPSLEEGKPLTDGRLALPAGIGEVTFANGVIVLLEGPGELEVLDRSRGFLHLGQAVVRIPEGAGGFTLETENVNVEDFGTEFAVRVEPSGETEVQVLDGAVVAQVKDADNKAVVERPLEAGQAIAVTVAADAELEPVVHKIAFAPGRFVRRLPEPVHVAVAETPDPAEAAAAAPLDGAVLTLSFDRDTITKDGDTLTFEDLSGSGNNGLAVGATWTEDGISGGACKLDGVDDYIACNDAPSLNIKGPMTISMWMNLEAWDNEGGLCTKGTGDGGDSWLIDMQGKRIRFARRPAAVEPCKQVLANESITPGKWYHVVAVADGRQLRLYTNMNQAIADDDAEEFLINNHALTIGSRRAHDGPYDANVAGVVDEIAIWPRALSPDEIEMLYRRGKEGSK